MKKAIKKIAMLFMVCVLAVSVSSAYDLREYDLERVQYVKNKIEYLELLKKELGFARSGESALKEGRLYLEFVEKVKQSKEKNCYEAVKDVMRDDSNEYRYKYYLWSDGYFTQLGCLTLSGFNDKLKEEEEYQQYNKELYDAFIRQKANVMGSGNGAGLKDGVTEVGTLSDGTKIEIVKEKK